MTGPVSRARALKSSSSPARTVRSLQLLLDDLQALGDLVLVGAGAVAAEQELADVGRHRVLARVLAHEVLADEVAVEDRRGELVEMVEGRCSCGFSDGRRLAVEDVAGRIDDDDRCRGSLVLVVGDGEARFAGWADFLGATRRCSSSACFQLRRRSTRTDGSFVVDAHAAPHAAPCDRSRSSRRRRDSPRSTTSSGTTHSCGLTPPCAYSVLGYEAARCPAATRSARRSSSARQCIGTLGFDSPLTVAQRAHFVAARYGGSSTLGSPPGSSSQPWSVTTRIRSQPDSRRPTIRSTRVSSSVSMCAASLHPNLVAQLVESAGLYPRTGGTELRRPHLVTEDIEPALRHLVAKPLRGSRLMGAA